MKFRLLLSLFILVPSLVSAETVQISEELNLSFSVPEGWEMASEPPAILLEEMAKHIAHEAKEKGHSPSHQQLLEAARKRLANNEVLLFNPQSKSYLTLDLSPQSDGERPPSNKTIRLSAKYAGESLKQEEGVDKLESRISQVSVAGSKSAYRYDADYLHHGEPKHFSGIIGFSCSHWYFFYFTDYLSDPEDQNRAEQVFKSLRIESRP